MATPKYIQPYGNQLMIKMSDGSTFLAVPTNSNIWTVNASGGDTPPTPGTGDFSWPFSTKTVTSEYGPRTGPIGSFHEGMDFGYSPATTGAKEYAAGAGVVEAINLNSNYGFSVQIKHGLNDKGARMRTIYAHMVSSPLVSVGDSVTKGQLLGYLGASGDAQGAHLHFETHTCPNDGPIVHNTSSTSSGLNIRTAINPRDFMAAYGDGEVLNKG